MSTTCMVLALVLSQLFLLAEPSLGEFPVATGAPAGYFFDGSVTEWRTQPASFDLIPKKKGGRAGQIWIRHTSGGLLIAGAVSGPPPQFASNQAEMNLRDHIELWVNLVADPKLPPVGWGGTSGPVVDKTAQDCEELTSGRSGSATAVNECRAWFLEQSRHRFRFRRLFTRQWQLTPSSTSEIFASPSFDHIWRGLSTKEKPGFGLLFPRGLPVMKAVAGTGPDDGYTFEVIVPWDVLPPADTLQLRDMNLMVDVFGGSEGATGYSTSSANRTFGEPNSFNHITLADSPEYVAGACHHPLEARDLYGAMQPAYYLPSSALQTQEIFLIENEARGSGPVPGGISPGVSATYLFEQELSPGKFVCGPDLAYRESDRPTVTLDAVVRKDSFGLRPMQNGQFLVKSGPLVWYSEGSASETGGSAHARLQLFLLDPKSPSDPKKVLTEALRLESPVKQIDKDIQLSADWRTVSDYEGVPDAGRTDLKWTLRRHCLNGQKYEVCGTKSAQPPNPRTLKF